MIMLRLTVIVFLAAALGTPALAATFWVVQDTTTKKCSIIEQDQQPSGDNVKVVGSPYKDQQTAENEINHILACGSQY
jgi:hypothetical protein